MDKFKGAKFARIGNVDELNGVEEDENYIREHNLDNKIVRIVGLVRYRGYTEYLCIINKSNVHKSLGWIESEYHEGKDIETYIDVSDNFWSSRDKFISFFNPYSLVVLRHCYVQPLESNRDAKIVLDTL